MSVNKQDLNDFFCNETQRTLIRYPLTITDNLGKFDVRATVRGGGISGQAGAIRLGITKALLEYNAELRNRLKRAGLLTRDSRIKERKKYGQKGARKRFQFSKR
jgi:small subunit ribosomal protein S9